MKKLIATALVIASLSNPASAYGHEPECFDEIDDRTGRISSCFDSRTMGNHTIGQRWLGWYNGADTWGPNRVNWYVHVKYFGVPDIHMIHTI